MRRFVVLSFMAAAVSLSACAEREAPQVDPVPPGTAPATPKSEPTVNPSPVKHYKALDFRKNLPKFDSLQNVALDGGPAPTVSPDAAK
jgi:hypothetical protein